MDQHGPERRIEVIRSQTQTGSGFVVCMDQKIRSDQKIIIIYTHSHSSPDHLAIIQEDHILSSEVIHWSMDRPQSRMATRFSMDHFI